MKVFLPVVVLMDPCSSGTRGDVLCSPCSLSRFLVFHIRLMSLLLCVDTIRVEKEVGGMEMAHEGMIWSLAWHPLGHILCSGSNDHTRLGCLRGLRGLRGPHTVFSQT